MEKSKPILRFRSFQETVRAAKELSSFRNEPVIYKSDLNGYYIVLTESHGQKIKHHQHRDYCVTDHLEHDSAYERELEDVRQEIVEQQWDYIDSFDRSEETGWYYED